MTVQEPPPGHGQTGWPIPTREPEASSFVCRTCDETLPFSVFAGHDPAKQFRCTFCTAKVRAYKERLRNDLTEQDA